MFQLMKIETRFVPSER